jgi:hypothetical protein
MDHNKVNLKQQLFDTPELHSIQKLRPWVQSALTHQRCIWGVHQAISKAQSKPFQAWFDKDENRGFFAYDSSTVMLMVRDLVGYHHEVAYEMMTHKDDTDPADYNKQAIRCGDLKQLFQELSGEVYNFEMPCLRDVDVCNKRRASEGGRNHNHEVHLDPPVYVHAASFEIAVELRMQCQKLGLNPSTGVVADIHQRCEIYRKRLDDHFEAMKKAEEAKKRNDSRKDVHVKEKRMVRHLSEQMLRRQCWDLCHLKISDRVVTIVKRGCDPNAESPKGMTPLACLVISDVTIELVEQLILDHKANPVSLAHVLIFCVLV